MSKNSYNSHRNLFQKTRLKNKNSEVTEEVQMKKVNIPIAIPCLLKATLFGTAFVLRRLGTTSNVKGKKKQKKKNKKNNNK